MRSVLEATKPLGELLSPSSHLGVRSQTLEAVFQFIAVLTRLLDTKAINRILSNYIEIRCGSTRQLKFSH